MKENILNNMTEDYKSSMYNALEIFFMNFKLDSKAELKEILKPLLKEDVLYMDNIDKNLYRFSFEKVDKLYETYEIKNPMNNQTLTVSKPYLNYLYIFLDDKKLEDNMDWIDIRINNYSTYLYNVLESILDSFVICYTIQRFKQKYSDRCKNDVRLTNLLNRHFDSAVMSLLSQELNMEDFQGVFERINNQDYVYVYHLKSSWENHLLEYSCEPVKQIPKEILEGKIFSIKREENSLDIKLLLPEPDINTIL